LNPADEVEEEFDGAGNTEPEAVVFRLGLKTNPPDDGVVPTLLLLLLEVELELLLLMLELLAANFANGLLLLLELLLLLFEVPIGGRTSVAGGKKRFISGTWYKPTST